MQFRNLIAGIFRHFKSPAIFSFAYAQVAKGSSA